VSTATSDLDRFRKSLTPDERALIGLLDLQRLELKQESTSAEFAANLAEPRYGLFVDLQIWELLVRRMEGEWRAVDYHLVDEYLHELTVRDEIDDYLEAMPPPLRGKVGRFVDRIDERFRAVTSEDGGAELAPHWKPLADGEEIRWWWTRKPSDLPPGW
jgi:hypothetical protein